MRNFAVALIILSNLFLASCEKDTDINESASVVGTWKLSEEGVDTDNNNVLDATEVSPTTLTVIFTFKSDNTYSSAMSTPSGINSENGTYTYSNNRIDMVYTVLGTTSYLPIFLLTKSKMIVKLSSGRGPLWYVYTK
jgi:hypothetical protein